MERTSFNRVSNLGNQGIKSSQVDQSPLSKEEVSRQFPSLNNMNSNTQTQVFNLLNLINRLWGNRSSAFAASTHIPQPTDKQLIVALLNLVGSLNLVDAQKLLKFCRDDNLVEDGISFKRIHGYFEDNPDVRGSITLDEFDAYINNQPGGDQVANLVENTVYNTPSARQIGVETLLRLLISSSKNIDRLKYFLEVVADFAFVENDPIDKQSMQKLAQQLDQHVYKQNDVIVALVNKIKSNVVPRAEIGDHGYGVNRPQHESFHRTGTNSNNPTQTDPQLFQGHPGYGGNRSQDASFRQTGTNLNNPAQSSPQLLANQPLITGELSNPQNPLRICGNDGKVYTVCSLLSGDKARIIDKNFGFTLKLDSKLKMYSSYLGGGQFGKVYVAEVGDNNFVALKIIEGDHNSLIQGAHESSIQKKLAKLPSSNESNLIPILDSVEYHNQLGELKSMYIMLPLAALGTVDGVHKYLKDLNDENMRNLVLLYIADEILLGIFQMHKACIYHLDLKSDNVLIDREGKVKLSDFGTSEEILTNPPKLVVGKDLSTGRFIGEGAKGYFAPERSHNSGSSFNPQKTDIYTVGAIFWEFITGEKFPYKNNQSAIQNNQEALNHPLLSNPQDDTLAHLTCQLLDSDPNKRPDAFAARGHKAFDVKTRQLEYQRSEDTVLDFLGRFVIQQRSKALTLNPTLAIPFDNRKDVLQQLKTYVPLNSTLTANYELTNNNNDIFPLVNKINKFIDDKNQAVLIILGDGGTGKSLFMQWLTTDLLNQRDNKKCFPLYVELSDVSDSKDIFRQQFGLNSDALRELSSQYQIVLIADGFDQMPNKVNLYVANKLYKFNIKLIVSTRINTLQNAYLEFFNPRIVHKNQSLEMMQVYLQQFNSSQIDDYIANYIKENKSELEQQIALNHLTSQWLNPDYTKAQIQKITGLYELMHTPFMCSLILAEIPKLISMNQCYNAYEVIIKGWISSQIISKVIPVSVEAVFEFAQKLAFTLQVDKITKVDLSQISFYIDPESGKRKKAQDRWDWFKEATTIRLVLPLELAKPNVHRFMHKSIQEFLVAHHLYTQLMQAIEFEDLDWNKITLSNDDPISNPILSFLLDILNVDNSFRDKLAKLSDYAKVNSTQTTALANVNNLYRYEYLQLSLLVEKNDTNQVNSLIAQILNDKTLDLDKKMEFLSAENTAGVPALNLAFSNGYLELAQEFTSLVLNASPYVLNKENKLKLFKAKDIHGTTGFNIALKNGHTNIVKWFINLLLNPSNPILHRLNKVKILLAKNKDGVPGFYFALQNGHAPAIKEFIILILNTNSSILSPANKLELLLAKDKAGNPGFYFALQNGHAPAIKEFVTLILNADSSILSPANKLELLLAKDKEGNPGFYWALYDDHAPAIKEFITLILNANSSILSPANKLELLLAKTGDGYTGFYATLYNGHAPAIKEFITLILNANSNILTPANKLELLLVKTSDGTPGFYMALQNDHAPAIKEFITLILNADSNILSSANKLELLLAKHSNGYPGFYIALQNGHAGAIERFITLILNADSSILSPSNKLELLLAKDNDGIPGFHVALQNGHALAIKEFTTLILNADSSILSPANKLELLLAKDKDSTPGFYVALEEVHAPAIKEFITLILNADSNILTPANKLELLLAKHSNGYPGFYMALQNGHAPAVKEFITLILNENNNILTPSNKLELLFAKDKYGIPGFYMALYNGHAPAIKAFITLILNADSKILSPANKFKLLLAKSDDFPGFYVALQNGHAEVIKEFFSLILNADSNILTPANKLELLLAKHSNGYPGFYMALQNGHAPAVKEFITLILNADSNILTPSNKLELLFAKDKYGTPGFYMALQNGRAGAIKDFITIILTADSSILSPANKFELLLAKSDGFQGFYVALQNGHAEVIKEFFSLILNADSSILSPANKLELLLAKDKYGVPGFYMALYNGHAPAIKEFVTLILNADNKRLSPANKFELLLAKRSDGYPGFYMALKEGHAPAIKEFITLILNADSLILSPANKLELLLAKDKYGVPGVFMALQNGHTPAIKEFIDLIKDAVANNVIHLQLNFITLLGNLYKITRSFLSAFKHGDSIAIKEFITLILNTDSSILNPANKLELLLAKSSDGVPGIIYMACNGYIDSMKNFIDLIKDAAANNVIHLQLNFITLLDNLYKITRGFFSAFEHGDAIAIKEFITLILNTDSSILSPANKLELLLAKDNYGVPGFYIALLNGHAPAIKEFITLILNADSNILSPANKLELLLAKNKDGVPGIIYMARNGYIDSMKNFIDLIKDAAANNVIHLQLNFITLLDNLYKITQSFLSAFKHGDSIAIKEFITLILNANSSILSPANKLELLLDKGNDGKPGFYVALQNGHAHAVKEFITLILNADSKILSPTNKLKLLLDKNKDGYPGFCVALQNGHAPAVKEFITLILNANSDILTPANKFELLLAKTSDGIHTGFNLALLYDKAETVKEFITLILNADSSILSPDNKLELLLAKASSSDVPGFYWALNGNNGETVKEFITLILNANSNILTPANKLELLLAKSSSGYPGFYCTLQNGQAETTKQFVILILNADSSILSPANKLELLLARGSSGVPGFYWALKNGRAEAIKQFVTLILNADSSILTTTNKLELLLAKNEDGVPGFFAALQKAHAEAIDEFINLIYNAPQSILTQEDKMLLLLARDSQGQLAITNWDKQLDKKLEAMKHQ